MLSLEFLRTNSAETGRANQSQAKLLKMKTLNTFACSRNPNVSENHVGQEIPRNMPRRDSKELVRQQYLSLFVYFTLYIPVCVHIYIYMYTSLHIYIYVQSFRICMCIYIYIYAQISIYRYAEPGWQDRTRNHPLRSVRL